MDLKQSEDISYSELFRVYQCSNAYPVMFFNFTKNNKDPTRAPATEELRLDSREIIANNVSSLEISVSYTSVILF